MVKKKGRPKSPNPHGVVLSFRFVGQDGVDAATSEKQKHECEKHIGVDEHDYSTL